MEISEDVDENAGEVEETRVLARLEGLHELSPTTGAKPSDLMSRKHLFVVDEMLTMSTF